MFTIIMGEKPVPYPEWADNGKDTTASEVARGIEAKYKAYSIFGNTVAAPFLSRNIVENWALQIELNKDGTFKRINPKADERIQKAALKSLGVLWKDWIAKQTVITTKQRPMTPKQAFNSIKTRKGLPMRPLIWSGMMANNTTFEVEK